MAINSFDNWLERSKVEEDAIPGSEDSSAATSQGLDVKSRETFAGGKTESILIDIVAQLEKETGFELEITAGNDTYHQNKAKEARRKGKSYNSKHLKGTAIDFVSKDRSVFKNSTENRLKMERAIINLIISG